MAVPSYFSAMTSCTFISFISILLFLPLFSSILFFLIYFFLFYCLFYIWFIFSYLRLFFLFIVLFRLALLAIHFFHPSLFSSPVSSRYLWSYNPMVITGLYSPRNNCIKIYHTTCGFSVHSPFLWDYSLITSPYSVPSFRGPSTTWWYFLSLKSYLAAKPLYHCSSTFAVTPVEKYDFLSLPLFNCRVTIDADHFALVHTKFLGILASTVSVPFV